MSVLQKYSFLWGGHPAKPLPLRALVSPTPQKTNYKLDMLPNDDGLWLKSLCRTVAIAHPTHGKKAISH
jgi:hypothetical protein